MPYMDVSNKNISWFTCYLDFGLFEFSCPGVGLYAKVCWPFNTNLKGYN